jgi:hypothetical protein
MVPHGWENGRFDPVALANGNFKLVTAGNGPKTAKSGINKNMFVRNVIISNS